MQIEAQQPFELSKDADGSQHAVKDNIQVTVTADIDAKINHKVGHKPDTGETSRWLHIDAGDKVERGRGFHVYINGTHVIITGRSYNPTFDLHTPEALLELAMKRLRIHKNERGAYVIDTKDNRKVLTDLFEMVEVGQKNRLMQWMKHAVARITD